MTFTERISENTWCMLKYAQEWEVSLGEETLTELLILNFMRFKPNHYRLFQINKDKEAKVGADLEIQIYAGHNKLRVFAIQAKKLSRSGRYESLNAKVGSSDCFQINVLEKYSRHRDQGAGAIPYYLLYNYVDDTRHWHCCKCPPSEKQLGCTLVPSWIIRLAISMRGHRNFHSIHKSYAAKPWRCLFNCPKGLDQLLDAARYSLSRSLSMFRESLLSDEEEQNYDWVNFDPIDGAWPEWVWEQEGATLSAEDFERFRQESRVAKGERVQNLENLDGLSEKLLPSRLLLVNTGTN